MLHMNKWLLEILQDFRKSDFELNCLHWWSSSSKKTDLCPQYELYIHLENVLKQTFQQTYQYMNVG